jgi:protease II
MPQAFDITRTCKSPTQMTLSIRSLKTRGWCSAVPSAHAYFAELLMIPIHLETNTTRERRSIWIENNYHKYIESIQMVTVGLRTTSKILFATYIVTCSQDGAKYMTNLLTHPLNDRYYWTTLSISGSVDSEVISIMWSKLPCCTKFLDLDIVTQERSCERELKRRKI